MRKAILFLLAGATLPLAACDIAQQAAEDQIRSEVSNRVGAAENAVREGTTLDERYGNVANDVMGGEGAIRARAEREVQQRAADAANAAMGRE